MTANGAGQQNGPSSVSFTATYPADTVVSLDAAAASATFVWGYWTGTDGASTGGNDVNMSTTVTMDADKSVLACCPFASSPNTPCGP